MIQGRRITVVVPAYSEQALITKTLDGIPPEIDRVIVVDDASPDRTAAIVSEREEARVALLRRERNGGVGAAIVSGYREFLRLEAATPGSDGLCVVMAGDAQMDPEDLPALLRPILDDGVGYAKGNRLLTPDVRAVMPGARYLGNIVFSSLTRIASGYWHISDSQCGYTVITREALCKLDLDSIYPRYGFPNDLLIRLNVAGVRACDVPVRAIYGDEKSGIRPWRVLPAIASILWKGFWWRLWHRYVITTFHPLIVLYAVGFLLCATGVGGAIALSWSGIDAEGAASPTTALLPLLLVLVGVPFMVFAMRLDSRHNRHLKAAP